MVSDKVFNTDGTQKIFSSDFAIISEDHLRVYLGTAVVSRDDYDLINNAAVFNVSPTAGQVMTLQVGTTPADILTSPTDAGIVAANIADVNTVAGISGDVSTLANITGDLSTVVADITNINTTATNIANVNTVATNIAKVSTVATDIAKVIAVADDLNEAISEIETAANDLNEAVSEIDTVATSITNVDTVGTNITNVNTVAGISANVTTVAGISANTTTVAGISADVTAVAGNNTNVSTVAGNNANVTKVANIDTNVTKVANIDTDVTKVANIDSEVIVVSGSNTNINTVATNIGNVSLIGNDLANNFAHIDDHGSITDTVTATTGTSNVKTVADDITNVNTVATNIAAINNFIATYLGPKASDPLLDNNGDALTAGDLYFNSVNNKLRIYSTTLGWMDAAITAGDFVVKTGDTMTGSLTATDFIGPLNGAVQFTAKNTSGGTITKGQAISISGISGNTPTVTLADADAATMPAFGLAATTAADTLELEIVTFGSLKGIQTDYTGWALGDTLYISTTAGTLTNVPPTGEAAKIQNIGTVERLHSSNGTIKVGGAGRTNATPNLNDGNVFIGNASNQSVSQTIATAVQSQSLDWGTIV